ncbi:hypothetical protein PIB30_038722 [Stylosanthes scabra]|uniref:Uncharacterized protein n=1 Tax=Stylosanthes scabra TaxID=79078 RepID=A0ABU6SE13_9FABA|nr:hypothetical protein [Stylosanthes scabra]
MAFLLNKTAIASHLRSHSQNGQDLLSLSRRQYHIEPGPREKALLAEDAALKPFKSYKQSVKQLKKIGNILTIVVAAVEERFKDRVEVMIMVENMNQMLDSVNKFAEERSVILEALILRMEVQLEQVKARMEHWNCRKQLPSKKSGSHATSRSEWCLKRSGWR